MYRQKNSYAKYKNVPQTYNGINYHSRFEAGYARDLDLRVKAKDIKSWERQVKIELTAHGKRIANYYVDFLIHHNDGSKEYVEVKGYETDTWKIKWKIFEAQMEAEEPGTVLTVVKQQSYWGGR